MGETDVDGLARAAVDVVEVCRKLKSLGDPPLFHYSDNRAQEECREIINRILRAALADERKRTRTAWRLRRGGSVLTAIRAAVREIEELADEDSNAGPRGSAGDYHRGLWRADRIIRRHLADLDLEEKTNG